jgi:hypothetical protein
MTCLPITQKKCRPKLPKIEGFILRSRIPSLALTYIGERRTTFAQAYDIKVRCYGEHVDEYIENWRNILRTCETLLGT